jgi:hypothetical protein
MIAGIFTKSNNGNFWAIANRVNPIKNIDWIPRPTVRVSLLLLGKDDGNKDIGNKLSINSEMTILAIGCPKLSLVFTLYSCRQIF